MNRRSFLTGSMLAVGAAAGTQLLDVPVLAEGRDRDRDRDDDRRSLTKGDVAVLTFLAAAELLEADLWQQYAELAGADSPESSYRAAIEVLDEDMPQYISDNTDDELSHATFLNAYLASKGVAPVNLDQFRTLPSSQATGALQIGRLTNLTRLTVDTTGGPGTGARRTRTSATRSLRRFRLSRSASTRRFLALMRSLGVRAASAPTSRRLPIPRAFTSRSSNRAARGSTPRWRRR